MIGNYVEGCGKAHKCCGPHTKVLGFPVIGTFNVLGKGLRINEFPPSIVTEKANYYFLRLERGDKFFYGWAVRDHVSKQGLNVLEILTKDPLPDSWKNGEDMGITLYERWSPKKTREWAANKYWFQTFPFSPKKRADSELVWEVIDTIDWCGLTVLDIGCHYGFFSFKASEKGARVVGIEPNRRSLRMARIIQEHIVQQDVKFFQENLKKSKVYDVILYLSVHHQIDPLYSDLATMLDELRQRTNKYLFVELIMPPIFPEDNQMSEEEIDRIVGGKILLRYKHNVRGDRKIYLVEKDA